MTYEFGEFVLNQDKRELLQAGKSVQIRAKALDLLIALAEQRGNPITRQELIRKVWSTNKLPDSSFDNTFNVTLSELRKALGESGREPRYIYVDLAGYRLSTIVEGTTSRRVVTEKKLAVSHSRTAHKRLGGHAWQVFLGCAMYACLSNVMLIAEVAYRYDLYGASALGASFLVFVYALITSIFAVITDWKYTARGSSKGLIICTLLLLATASLMFAGGCLFLPTLPITQQRTQSATAQSAYLKDMIYHLLLFLPFFVTPLHFVFALQKELQSNEHRAVLKLLTGRKLGTAPKGAIFLRPWVLGVVLLFFATISHNAHNNLVSSLVPGPYMNLFTNLLLIRLALFFGLALECLVWYYWALDELKRQCLGAEQRDSFLG